MEFLSSTKITRYRISDNIVGCINTEKSKGKVHLEATIYDISKLPIEYVVVFTGEKDTVDAAPLLGESISIFMNPEWCKKRLKEYYKEEQNENNILGNK